MRFGAFGLFTLSRKYAGNASTKNLEIMNNIYIKTCVKRPLSKRPKIGFQNQLPLNAGQKYCRMLPLEYSAIPITCIKLPFVIKIFVLSIFEWPFYTGFTVLTILAFSVKK